MSDTATTEQAGIPQQPVGADDYRPAESLSSEPEAPPQASTPEPAEADAAPEAEQHRETDAERLERERKEFNRRLGQATRQKYQEKERAAALERRLAELEARAGTANGQDPNGLPPDWANHPQVRAQIQALAAEEARIEAFHRAAYAEFPDWDKRRKDLQEMGADGGIAQILVEMPQGHRVAAALYDEPGELERIADLKTERARAIALGQFAARIEARRAVPPSPQPRRASSLSEPIRPPATARSSGQPDPEKGSMAEYEKWSRQQNWRNR